MLREILGLVAERANAEAKVEGERTSSTRTADSEYEKTRRALIEKLQSLETEANAADEKHRRAIVDAALDGERKAKAEFAAASRKLATLFDAARDSAKNDYGAGQGRRCVQLRFQPAKAAKEHAEKTKPIDDSARMANGYRERLAVLAADYKKFKLNPEAPAPTRESYDRYSDPGDELFTRLARMEPPIKLLESLIIPKAMKGAGEVWVFVLIILPLVGLGFALSDADSIVYYVVAAAVVGGVLAFILRTWLVKLSQSQLESRYVPLMHSLADADALTAHCRGLVDAAFKEERKKIAARREDELKRVDDNYRKAFVVAEATRDEKLRKINEVYANRMVEVQTTQQRDMRDAIEQHDRRVAELRGQVESSLPRLDENYKSLKEKLVTQHERAWQEMADRWREGMKAAAAELECDQPRG